MPRLNPIWLAIPSFGVLIGVARADPQSCPSQVIPSLLPHTSTAASKQKPRTEKSVATGGDYNVQADKSEYDVTSDTAIFTGNVVIRQGERLLKADRVQIDTKKNVKGQGGVDYTDPIVHILGAGGDYSPTGGADFKSAQFELLQRPARGSAETMTLTPEGILNLQSVSFTTCPANEESWALVAKDITLDTRAKVGEAHDATIEFEGVPILYLPRMSFPLGDAVVELSTV
jgi:LPS-assembly protein